jgi:hypothetical protein
MIVTFNTADGPEANAALLRQFLPDTRDGDLHSIALSLARIDTTLSKIAVCICSRPGSFTETHSEPISQGVPEMAKVPGKFGIARVMKSGGGQVGFQDTVTIGGFLNNDNTPYTGAPPTITSTSATPAALALDPPVGLTYGEHFLAPGAIVVTIVATFPDPAATVVTQTDTVTLTPAPPPAPPGSFTVTHSLPVVGP